MPIKIVLIEDSETVQIAAKMVMHSEREYEVLCLNSPKELATLGKVQPDLFIVDWSLFDETQSEWISGRPVVFLFGAQGLAPTTSLPKSHFLKKPFDSQSLLKSIQTVLATEQKTASKPTLSLPPMETFRPKPAVPAFSPQQAANPGPQSQMGMAHLPINAEELREMARKVIEEVAWEVVPELAESIIREELRRLTKDKT